MCGERGGSIVESSSAFWRDQNPGPWLRMAANNTRLANTPSFLRQFKLSAVLLSVLLVLPCVWHRRIEAGDLASHVYNAWFVVALLRTAKLVGFPAAQRIVVSVCVLIFFWGVFAFVGTITERPPWFLTPCIAMLAYGYSFNMGFINYYLSLGLACFGLAILWRGSGFAWIAGALIALLAVLAHPIGFLWLLGTLAYVWIRAKLPGWWKLALPLVAASGFFAVYWYV